MLKDKPIVGVARKGSFVTVVLLVICISPWLHHQWQIRVSGVKRLHLVKVTSSFHPRGAEGPKKQVQGFWDNYSSVLGSSLTRLI